MADFDRDGDMEPMISGAPFNSVPDRALFENRRPAGGTVYASFLYASSDGQARAAIMLAADLDGNGLLEAVFGEHAGRLLRLPRAAPAARHNCWIRS